MTGRNALRGITRQRFLGLTSLGVLGLAACSTDKNEAKNPTPDNRASTGQSSGPAAFDSKFTHHTANVNGVQIHYVIGGRGDPIVLLHGFPETWYTWHKVMPSLAEKHTVIAPDLRGVGESSLEDSGYDKTTMAEDVYQLVRKLGLGEVSVVGHDLGAWVAYAYVREHREEVRRLVFMSAGLPGFGLERLLDFREPGQGLPHLVYFMKRDLPTLIEGQERYFLTNFVAGGEDKAGSVSGTEAMDEYVRAYSGPGRIEAGLKQYRALYQDAEDNRKGAMPKLTMPVLALGRGSGAPGLALDSMRQVAKNVVGSGIEGSGHFLQEEQSEEVASRLLNFLQ